MSYDCIDTLQNRPQFGVSLTAAYAFAVQHQIPVFDTTEIGLYVLRSRADNIRATSWNAEYNKSMFTLYNLSNSTKQHG